MFRNVASVGWIERSEIHHPCQLQDPRWISAFALYPPYARVLNPPGPTSQTPTKPTSYRNRRPTNPPPAAPWYGPPVFGFILLPLLLCAVLAVAAGWRSTAAPVGARQNAMNRGTEAAGGVVPTWQTGTVANGRSWVAPRHRDLSPDNGPAPRCAARAVGLRSLSGWGRPVRPVQRQFDQAGDPVVRCDLTRAMLLA